MVSVNGNSETKSCVVSLSISVAVTTLFPASILNFMLFACSGDVSTARSVRALLVALLPAPQAGWSRAITNARGENTILLSRASPLDRRPLKGPTLLAVLFVADLFHPVDVLAVQRFLNS